MNAPYFPVFIDLLGAHVVVVGAGQKAERCVNMLLRFGPRLTLVAPQATPGLGRACEDGKLRWIAAPYSLEHLDDAALVFAATPDPVLQHRICEDCRAVGVWVHRLDEPSDSTFHVPQLLERGPVRVAIHALTAPSLADRLVRSVADAAGPEYGILAEWLAEPVEEGRLKLNAEEFRTTLGAEAMKSSLLELLREGKARDARARFEELRRVCLAAWSA